MIVSNYTFRAFAAVLVVLVLTIKHETFVVSFQHIRRYQVLYRLQSPVLHYRLTRQSTYYSINQYEYDFEPKAGHGRGTNTHRATSAIDYLDEDMPVGGLTFTTEKSITARSGPVTATSFASAAALFMTINAIGLMRPASASADAAAADASKGLNAPKPTRLRNLPRARVYSVEMTNPPCLQPRTSKGELGALQRLARAKILFFGLHDGTMNSSGGGGGGGGSSIGRVAATGIGSSGAETTAVVVAAGQQTTTTTAGAGRDITLALSLLDGILATLPGDKLRGTRGSSSDRGDLVVGLTALPRSPSIRDAIEEYFQSDDSLTTTAAANVNVRGNGGDVAAITTMDTTTSTTFTPADERLLQTVQKQFQTAGIKIDVGSLEWVIPVFRWARRHHVRVEPMGVPPDILAAVNAKGLEALDESTMSAFVRDKPGFLSSVQSKAFRRYTDKVLVPAYYDLSSSSSSSRSSSSSSNAPPASAAATAPPSPSASPECFVSRKILEHEAAASLAARIHTGRDILERPPQQSEQSEQQGQQQGREASPASTGRLGLLPEKARPSTRPLVVVMADEFDCKFGFGLQERAERSLEFYAKDEEEAAAAAEQATASASSASSENTPSSVGPPSSANPSDDNYNNNNAAAPVYSVLLNPTAQDSLSDTAQLRLVLSYGKFLDESRRLADFLWYADSPAAKLITRPKNPISNEGDKPAGESSIIGAF